MISAEVKSSMEGKDYKALMEQAIERGLTAAAIAVEAEAILQVPVDSGRLRGSITYATSNGRSRIRRPAKSRDRVSSPRGENTAYVGTNVEYAQHVEYGTRPHEINAPVFISKKVGGKKIGWRYIKMHPGTKAKSFMRKALDNKRKAIVRIYHAEVKKALSGGI
jgi:HK97 gp10 family phage protein